MTIQCYHCGKFFSKSEITAEHIPAKNLFEGYKEEYKKNRITVTGCYPCNNGYSSIDAEIRDIVGMTNDSNTNQNILTEKSVRSITRHLNGLERINFVPDSRPSIEFYYWKVESLHKKHFRALVFHEFKEFFDDEVFSFKVICNGDENDENANSVLKSMKSLINPNGDWSFSGHPDIFRYRIKSIKEIIGQQIIYSERIENSICIVAYMEYHKKVWALVYAMDNKFTDQPLKNQKQPAK